MAYLIHLLAGLSFAWSFGCAAGPLQLGVSARVASPSLLELVLPAASQTYESCN